MEHQIFENEYGLTVSQIMSALVVMSFNGTERVYTINDDDVTHGISFIQSWRGSYDEPSFRMESDSDVFVNDVQSQLSRIFRGEEFTGYKGGNYVFNKDQILRVTRYGEATDRRIVKVSKSDDGIIYFHAQVFEW